MNHDTEIRRQVAAATANWTAATSLSFAVDLVPASLRLRQLLAAVDRQRCLYSGPAVSFAIRRYENCWLPLLAEHGDKAIIPPLDCAWIWYCHRLSPLAYARDCEHLYGRLLGSPPAYACVADTSDTTALSSEALRHTQTLWEQRFPNEAYEPDLSGFHESEADEAEDMTELSHQSAIHYDLRNAVKRQSSFYYQISESHMGDETYLRGAEQRYKGFLYLFKMTEFKIFLVPTYDVDLMWHAHQLHPQAYAHDTKAILGKVLQHDDTDSDRSFGKKLDEGFQQTSRLWLESYGRVYERAGAMYRGEPPQPIQVVVDGGIPSDDDDVDAPLEIREVMQVHFSVVGARNISWKQKGRLRVRLQLQSKCSAFKLDTQSISPETVQGSDVEQVWWNRNWRFEADISTEGVWLELRLEPSNPIKSIANRGNVVLGRLWIPWKIVLESTTLSLDGWFRMSEPPKLSHNISGTPPSYLFVSVSLTPPVRGPQLLRTIKSIVTDDTGKMDLAGPSVFGSRKGCWMTRTVLDRANREVFIVRRSYSDGQSLWYKRTPENQKRIYIHRGGWVYRRSRGAGTAPADIAASAEQIVSGLATREVLANERRWGIVGNSSFLIVRRASTERETISAPLLELRGHLAKKMSLVSGRRLEYEVKEAGATDEVGFVTVVRHHQSGATHASALFNWRSGAMEVAPDESVVLVLLLSAMISASVLDMQGWTAKLRKVGSPPKRPVETSGDEWGSVTLDYWKGVRSKKVQRAMAPYLRWWKTGARRWASAFYSPENASFLGDSQSRYRCREIDLGDSICSILCVCCEDDMDGDDGDDGGGCFGDGNGGGCAGDGGGCVGGGGGCGGGGGGGCGGGGGGGGCGGGGGGGGCGGGGGGG